MFNTLTEFFSWLSINPREGATYGGLAQTAAYPPPGQEAASRIALQTYLTGHVKQMHVDLITEALTKNNGHMIPDAVNAEQLGPVNATFDGVSLIW